LTAVKSLCQVPEVEKLESFACCQIAALTRLKKFTRFNAKYLGPEKQKKVGKSTPFSFGGWNLKRARQQRTNETMQLAMTV